MKSTLAAILDVLSIMVFVVVGRRNHEEGLTVDGVLETAAPFLIGLVIAWLMLRAWRRPTDWTVGAAIWLITLVGGLVLRRLLFDDGTAVSFIIVTALFLAATMIGWRAIGGRLLNRG